MTGKTGHGGRVRAWFTSPLSGTSRGMLVIGGIILPVLCHLVSIRGLPVNRALWQSGEFHDRLSFILTPTAGFILYPFLAMAIVSLAVYLFGGPGIRRSFWVGFGLFNGVCVATWYIGIFAIVLTGQVDFDLASTLRTLAGFGLLALIPLVLWSIAKLVVAVARKLGCSAGKTGVTVFLSYWIAISLYMAVGNGEGFSESVVAPVWVPFMLSIWLAPVWAIFTYVIVAARWLTIDRTTRQFTLFQLLGLITYVAGLIATCRTAVRLSLDAYLQLPVEPQGNCYVATAAARGHPRVVRSVVAHQGMVDPPILVNRQLQVLKAFEITLQSLLPGAHRRLRQVYNTIGPPLARRVNRNWKADLAYLLLKPAEWFAVVVLSAALGRDRSIIDRFYFDAGEPNR